MGPPAPADPTVTLPAIAVVCTACGGAGRVTVRDWRCACGAAWTPVVPPFDPGAIAHGTRTVWRYAANLPPLGPVPPVTLGEGGTPLADVPLAGRRVWAKLEHLQPSGAYKDRGAAVLAAALAGSGVTDAVEDSSGNAGASLAACLARAGIALRLFVPAGTPVAKRRQALAHGAVVVADAPSRQAATDRAQAAIGPATAYASHVYSPWFLAGQMTLAWEIWEDLGRRAPDHVVVPAGHGLLLLGLYHGFEALARAGLVERVPALHGAQADACAPLAAAFARGAAAPVPAAPR
ncbi:threonine synthase, partial [bacterium]